MPPPQDSNTKAIDHHGRGTAMAALCVAICAVIISGATFAQNRGWLFPGDVSFQVAAGYAVYHNFLSFPSDHIAIPITWRNSTVHPVVVSDPRLILSGAGKKYTFLMYEELPEISDTAIVHYTHTDWVVLQPQSVSTHISVFGTKNRWNSKDPDHDFRFPFQNDTVIYLRADLEYSLIDDSSISKRSTLLMKEFPLYPGINGIPDLHYDFFWIR